MVNTFNKIICDWFLKIEFRILLTIEGTRDRYYGILVFRIYHPDYYCVKHMIFLYIFSSWRLGFEICDLHLMHLHLILDKTYDYPICNELLEDWNLKFTA